MSRNTIILLGVLAGSVALVGCSKNITGPQAQTERKAQTLTAAVPEKDKMKIEVAPDWFKQTSKLRDQMLEGGLGSAVAGQASAVPEKDKMKIEVAPDWFKQTSKLRDQMLEGGSGDGGTGPVAPAPSPKESSVGD